MNRSLVRALAGVVVALALATPAGAIKILDPTPNGAFSDTEGNQGYVEVASDDGSGAVLRVCNERPQKVLGHHDDERGPTAGAVGDGGSGYVWVNPSREHTRAQWGNEVVGFGDADGYDEYSPGDGDGDTNDDCAGNRD